jgi:hypothetical protein
VLVAVGDRVTVAVGVTPEHMANFWMRLLPVSAT